MATTRWKDNESTNIIEVINKIISPKENLDRYINIHTTKYFEENQTAMFGGRNITFNYISYSFDFIRFGNESIEDRTTRNTGFIIVYFNGTSINYIINRNSDAKRVLRILVGYTGQNEIQENNIDIKSDFFVWLISKVFKSENSLIIDENDKTIVIDTIKGFKGDSADELTKISADGRSVMNIISTLSFILESSLLNQIKIDIEYLNHENIELILSTRNTISTLLKEYDGDYDEFTIEKHTSFLFLLIYLEIMPAIYQIYQIEIENGDWGTSKYREFLNLVAGKLQENVTHKLEQLGVDIE